MRVRWLRVAAVEARDARLFYECRREGLGARFTRELRATLRSIQELPLVWPEVDGPIRRALVNRFPYLVHNAVERDEVMIVGMYHAKRRPIAWRSRL
jgi:toxin ParE1/3/4